MMSDNSNKNKRLASDIILNIENILIRQDAYIKNIDNNIKILMNKLKVIEETLKNVSVPIDEQKNNGEQLPTNTDTDVQRQTKIVMTPHGPVKPTMAKPPSKQQADIISASENSNNEPAVDKNVIVSQKLLYPNGEKIVYANIEIADINNNVITTCKTNTEGKWIKQLPPGNYNIRLTKKSTNDKSQSIDARYSIIVPDSVQSIDLPSPKFN